MIHVNLVRHHACVHGRGDSRRPQSKSPLRLIFSGKAHEIDHFVVLNENCGIHNRFVALSLRDLRLREVCLIPAGSLNTSAADGHEGSEGTSFIGSVVRAAHHDQQHVILNKRAFGPKIIRSVCDFEATSTLGGRFV